MKYVLLAVVALTFSGNVGAASARDTLNRYLALDTAGVRLQEWDSNNYLLHPEREPGWDTLTLITTHKVAKQHCGKTRCEFLVNYQLAATSGETQVTPHPNGGTEEIKYSLVLKGHRWLVENMVEPHVSQEAYVRLRL